MLFLKNKIHLFTLGFIVIIYGCNLSSKKQNKPETQINQQADSLLLLCLSILDTTEHKYQYEGHPFYMPIFMKNYIEHELDSTIPLKALCVDQYIDKVEYDSLRLVGMFSKHQFDEYNKDTIPKKINAQLVSYFNYVSIDSIIKYNYINSNYKIGKYYISKPFLSKNEKYIYFEWSEQFSGWYCIFEKNGQGKWIIKKMEMRYIE